MIIIIQSRSGKVGWLRSRVKYRVLTLVLIWRRPTTVVCVVILALAVHCNIEHVLPHMARRANRRCVQQNLVHCPICHIEHSSRQYVIGERYLPKVIGTKIFPISEDG